VIFGLNVSKKEHLEAWLGQQTEVKLVVTQVQGGWKQGPFPPNQTKDGTVVIPIDEISRHNRVHIFSNTSSKNPDGDPALFGSFGVKGWRRFPRKGEGGGES